MMENFKNVFVLGTGRCGTLSFINACSQMTNYSAGHETRSGLVGQQRLAYPMHHIEADNRLTWMLGRVEKCYGNNAYYVHLRRDPTKTAESFAKRYKKGIIYAYRSAILLNASHRLDRIQLCYDYVQTVTANIEVFLKGKSHQIEIEIDRPEDGFAKFWSDIGAQGTYQLALNDLLMRHNASPSMLSRKWFFSSAANILGRR